MGKFQDYVLYKENNLPIVSKVKLARNPGDEDFQPFVVDKDNHSNLRVLVKAFENSPQIGVGYTTMDKKTDGEIEPKLKKKIIYLTGGAVRDHLKGKTPTNYDLVTDATSSEIKLILKGNGFEETQASRGNKSFFVNRADKKNKPIEFTVVINGENFELSPLSKSIKNRNLNIGGSVTSNLEADAATRDFTINAMYIPLKNSEGENTELLDVYGGAHHLKNGQIVSIGKFSKRVNEDPMTAHRYLRMQARYGNEDIPEDHIESMSKINDLNKNYKKEYILGLENPEINDRKYLDMYKSTGLLSTVYPMDNLSVDDVPEKAYNDRFLTSAWLMKDKSLDQVKFALSSAGWEPREVEDIAHLIGMYQAERNNYPQVSTPCGLSDKKVSNWKNIYSASAW